VTPSRGRTLWYLNLNYVCNERCVFCAAELAEGNSARIDGRQPVVGFDDVVTWLGGDLPAAGDQVALAGGEPTLHRRLVDITRLLSHNRPEVALFTNGLRLASGGAAEALVDAGVSRFVIPLYGATDAAHDAVTRRIGSFEATLSGLGAAIEASAGRAVVEVRLLVSRQTVGENPDIVRLVHERLPSVDEFGLNRLILSEDAARADATVSWADARASVNETAALIGRLGHGLVADGIPLCVFDGENAPIRRAVATRAERVARGLEPGVGRVRYLDPAVATGQAPERPPRRSRALPEPCCGCSYRDACAGVERWYLARFGTAGLRPLAGDDHPVGAGIDASG
jgi:MoaA/NifB/PqqE/SkfB family radical SAM enzyme